MGTYTPKIAWGSRAERRAAPLEAIESAHTTSSAAERCLLETEASRRAWSLRYRLKLRAQKIADLELQLVALRVLQTGEIAVERSVTLWLRLWSPALAADLETSTAGWPR